MAKVELAEVELAKVELAKVDQIKMAKVELAKVECDGAGGFVRYAGGACGLWGSCLCKVGEVRSEHKGKRCDDGLFDTSYCVERFIEKAQIIKMTIFIFTL